MAYAAKRASETDRVIYLNLEHFSSTESYFKDEAKSISALFEGLGSNNMEITHCRTFFKRILVQVFYILDQQRIMMT